MLPPQPKSLDPPRGAGLATSGLFLAASGAAAHALSPHTSDPPQLLEPPIEPIVFEAIDAVGAAGAGGDFAARLLVRLKTELAVFVGDEMVGLEGAAAGGEGVEKSKRSPKAAEAG